MGGKTSAASINKYMSKAYDRINFTVVKGQKDIIREHAEKHGQSINAFIQQAIQEKIQRDDAGE